MSEATVPLVAAVVRTPAGAKKYGQPIGSTIVRDVLPDVQVRRPLSNVRMSPTVPMPHLGHVPSADEVSEAARRIEEAGSERRRGAVGSAAYLDAAGYNDPPTVLSTKEFDAFQGVTVHNYGEDGIESLSTFWRGTCPTGVDADPYTNLTTAAPTDYYVGFGCYSTGTHVGDAWAAARFSNSLHETTRAPKISKRYPDGSILMRVKIHPDARVGQFSDVPRDTEDVAAWAVQHHYDVLDLSSTRDSSAGIAVINRSVMVVEEMLDPIPPKIVHPIGSTVEWGAPERRLRGEVIDDLGDVLLVRAPWGSILRLNPLRYGLTQAPEGTDSANTGRVASAGIAAERGHDIHRGGANNSGLAETAVGLPGEGRSRIPTALGAAHRALSASATSWRWQLRDEDGQWIEMGAEVRWLSKGRYLQGRVVGSPSPGMATVTSASGERYTVPSSRLRLAEAEPEADVSEPLATTTAPAPTPSPVSEARVEKAHVWPVRKRIADLQPGDVYTRMNVPVEVTELDLTGDPPTLYGVYLDGPLRGRATRSTVNPGADIRVVADPVRPLAWAKTLQKAQRQLNALQKKYPDGVASALAAALEPSTTSPPEISPALSKRLKSPTWTAWDAKRVKIKADINKLPRNWTTGQVSAAYVGEELDLEMRLAELDPEVVGGTILTTQRMLEKHQADYTAWLNRPRYVPASPEAQKILDEVQAIGATVRLGIDIEVARHVPRSAQWPSLDDGSADSTAAIMLRQQMAREAVAALVGVTDAQPTWTDITPEAMSDMTIGRYIRPLDTDEKSALTEALRAYPGTWSSRFAPTAHAVGLVTRGFYSRNKKQLVVSDHRNAGVDVPDADIRVVMSHEIGHGMEVVIPGLPELETVFWAQRMGKDSPLKVHDEDDAYFPDDIPGNVAHRTVNRYSLKSYTVPPFQRTPQQWEVFTTGVQDVMSGRTTMTYGSEGDTGLWDMAMGAMLTLDGKPVKA